MPFETAIVVFVPIAIDTELDMRGQESVPETYFEIISGTNSEIHLWHRLGSHLPVAEHDPLAAREALETDRTSRVQLVRGDADLRAQAVLVAVGKARRRVYHHGARVDFAHEAHGVGVVFRDDCVGMLRAITRDVIDRGVERIDNPNR